jgi:hypothetical protein
LLADSPAINTGINLGDMGLHDFFDKSIPSGAAYDISAGEWQGK